MDHLTCIVMSGLVIGAALTPVAQAAEPGKTPQETTQQQAAPPPPPGMAEAGKGTAAPSPAGKAPTAYFSGPRKAGTGQMPTEETSTNK